MRNMLKRTGFILSLVILGLGLILFLAWYLPAQIQTNDCQKKYDDQYQELYQHYWELQNKNRFINAREFTEEDMENSSQNVDLRNAKSSSTTRLILTLIVIAIGVVILLVDYKKYNDIQSRISQRDRLGTILKSNPTIIIQSAELGHNYKVWIDGYLDDNTWHAGHYVTRWGAGPDDAHGWSYKMNWVSGFEKTIKYLVFHTRAINSVGDPARSEIGGNSSFDLKVVGPISRAIYQESLWETLIYYNTSIRMDIESIDVQFMDDTIVKINKNNIVRRNDLPKLQEM